jgi:nucleoside 2-deoxyribosyltransferase
VDIPLVYLHGLLTFLLQGVRHVSKFKIFMIMPFDAEFNDLYDFIKGLVNDEKVDVFRADDLLNQQNILKDIVLSINNSDLIMADLTGLNSNVFYELGLAHALRKNVILLTQDVGELPFDLRSYRVIQYSTNFKKIRELEIHLKRIMKEILNGEFSFGSPVTDWLPIVDSSMSGAHVAKHLEEEHHGNVMNGEGDGNVNEDKGLLDHMAEMEESMTSMTQLVDQFTKKTEEMGEELNRNAAEIQRAFTNNSNGTASFVRKIARKTARTLNEYGIYMSQQNTEYEELWNTFEESVAGLLTNPRLSGQAEGVTEISQFINVMEGLRDEIVPAKDAISEMAESASSLKGVESSMTRAVSIIEGEMKGFAGLLDKSVSTLDRIVLLAKDKSANSISNNAAMCTELECETTIRNEKDMKNGY